MTEVGAGLLVLHAIGDPDGGAPWAEAFSTAGWPGAVHAPDLPGHAGCPPPLGGSYTGADPALTGALVVAGLGPGATPPVVVGVGASGWAAQLLALGGRASALVLVDGLGGPWRDAAASVAAERQWLRGLADDPGALAPPPPGSRLDPRLHHGVPPQSDRRLALRSAAAVGVPVLVVETRPAAQATLSPLEAEELLGAFPAADRVRLDDASPLLVAETTVGWAAPVTRRAEAEAPSGGAGVETGGPAGGAGRGQPKP